MAFLKAYKFLFNLYFLLGVCPFRVNLTKKSVECTLLSWGYSVILYFSMSYSVFYSGLCTVMHEDFIETCSSGTCNYALVIQSLIIFVFFVISSLHTIVYRFSHALFLNGIVELEESVMKHFNIEILPNALIRKIVIRNSLFVTMYFLLNISAIYGLEINQNNIVTIYHYFFAFEVIIISLTVVHVIAICSILKECSELLLIEIRQLIQEVSSKNNDQTIKVYQVFHFLDNINELKIKMCDAFGFRLLINQAMDFVLLTVAVYYFILVNLPIHFQFHWMQLYFAIVYIVPVIVKNFALVVATDTLGNQVSQVQVIEWCTVGLFVYDMWEWAINGSFH